MRQRNRIRTVFTENQIKHLDHLFSITDYPSTENRAQLAKRTGLSEETVRVRAALLFYYCFLLLLCRCFICRQKFIYTLVCLFTGVVQKSPRPPKKTAAYQRANRGLNLPVLFNLTY